MVGQDISDARTLACCSDIRFEIADADDKEFLQFLKTRESFMRELIKRLDKAEVAS